MNYTMTRRKFIRFSLATSLLMGANLAWATFFERHWTELVQVEVRLPRLPAAWDGVTVVQLSDLHHGSFVELEFLQDAVDIANAAGGDLIVVTGDYVTNTVKHAEPCAQLLGQLRAPLGVYTILGNHDHWTDAAHVTRALQAAGLPVLRNAAVPLTHGGARVWLAGVDDIWEHKQDLALALRGVPPDEAVILLAHEPDFADQAAEYPVDLQLSGHSHGGQIRFPFVGAPYVPRHAIKYPCGLAYAGHLPVYTNRGLGVVPPAVRWNCRPEVTRLTLRAG